MNPAFPEAPTAATVTDATTTTWLPRTTAGMIAELGIGAGPGSGSVLVRW